MERPVHQSNEFASNGQRDDEGGCEHAGPYWQAQSIVVVLPVPARAAFAVLRCSLRQDDALCEPVVPAGESRPERSDC